MHVHLSFSITAQPFILCHSSVLFLLFSFYQGVPSIKFNLSLVFPFSQPLCLAVLLPHLGASCDVMRISICTTLSVREFQTSIFLFLISLLIFLPITLNLCPWVFDLCEGNRFYCSKLIILFTSLGLILSKINNASLFNLPLSCSIPDLATSL